MTQLPTTALHLTSTWFIRPGCDRAVDAALAELVAAVQAHEPDTLCYMAHRPAQVDGLQSLPPATAQRVVFFEIYRDVDAFRQHVSGPVFRGFLAKHAELFVSANGSTFTFVDFLHLQQGFIRDPQRAHPRSSDNQHPAVMFEIIANHQERLLAFYRQVFGWNYESGSGGFAYIKFPVEVLPLLGGIGQANSAVPGFEPGRNFYLRVEDLQIAIDNVVAAGGSTFVSPVQIDGYKFAMVKDPEGNVIGLIEPFAP